jgi:hypothetical protein
MTGMRNFHSNSTSSLQANNTTIVKGSALGGNDSVLQYERLRFREEKYRYLLPENQARLGTGLLP